MKTKKILVAEDDAVNQFIIEKMFKDDEYSLLIVNDGLEVYNEVKKNQFDLILMDINMPKLDGIEQRKKFEKKKRRLENIYQLSGLQHMMVSRIKMNILLMEWMNFFQSNIYRNI